MKKLLFGVLCAAASTTAFVAPAAAKGKPLDKLYEQSVKEYWIWAFNQPEEENPLLGNAPFCGESESGKVAFLSGTFLDGPQERSCDIGRGQRLYLSILSSNYIAFESDPAETKTYDAMLSYVNCATDATASVTVDGKTFDVSGSYTKTGVYDFPVYEGSLLEELLAGESADGAITAGIHVMLPPLRPGQHTVSWHAESLNCGYDTDGDGVNDEKLIKHLVYTIHVD